MVRRGKVPPASESGAIGTVTSRQTTSESPQVIKKVGGRSNLVHTDYIADKRLLVCEHCWRAEPGPYIPTGQVEWTKTQESLFRRLGGQSESTLEEAGAQAELYIISSVSL